MKSYKLAFLGDQGVGKTSVLSRIARDEFNENTSTTVGISYLEKLVPVTGTSATVKFKLYDTAGQERYRSVAKLCYSGSAVIFMVYDITNKHSFDCLNDWFDELRENTESDVIVYLLANKSDLLAEQTVLDSEAEEYARKQGAIFRLVSAKTNEGIPDLMGDVVRRLRGSGGEADPAKLAAAGTKLPMPTSTPKSDQATSAIVQISSNPAGGKQRKKKCC